MTVPSNNIEATIVKLDSELPWLPFDIPGGTSSVEIVRLAHDPTDGARTLVVRFPAGWQRPASGHYESAEEIVFLKGGLTMSGLGYSEGDWAWIPEDWRRSDTSVETETLTLARFSGPATWVSSDGQREDRAPASAKIQPADGRSAMPSPLGEGRGWLLRRGPIGSAWVTDAPPPGQPSPVDAEVLDITGLTWAMVRKGTPFPALGGPCFTRTFEPQEGEGPQ